MIDELIAFMTARLDEDERELEKDPPAGLGYANLPARMRREIAAKRAILARYEDCLARMEDPEYSQMAANIERQEYEDWVLPNLGMAWADHPEYRAGWKP